MLSRYDSMLLLQDNLLERLKVESIKSIVDSVDKYGSINLSFSGGKDSHAVLGLVIEAINKGLISKTDITVLHSDTTIEYPTMVDLTFKTLDYVKSLGIPVVVARAVPEERFFAKMIGYGFPVPSVHARWCTKVLKIEPMNRTNKYMHLTGEHRGESNNRDAKLSTCGSTECGIDKLAKDSVIRPIISWRNCDVWDYLFTADAIFYTGFFNTISSVYSISENEKGSLRMGCIGCPVISVAKHYKTDDKGCPSALSIALRLLLEEMRSDKLRLMNPRPPKNGTRTHGALAVMSRKYYWQHIKVLNDKFAQHGITLISTEECKYIEHSLSIGRYPKTYKVEDIERLERDWWNDRCPEYIKEFAALVANKR